jgi:hypothetical protein
MALGLVGAIYGIATILGPSVGSLILDLFGTEKDYGNGMDKKTQKKLFKRFLKDMKGILDLDYLYQTLLSKNEVVQLRL